MPKMKRALTEGYIPSIVLSSLLAGLFLALAILIWAQYPPLPDIMKSIENVNVFLADLVEGVLMIFSFMFLIIDVALIREYTRVIAGWTEVISVLIVVLLITYAMFGPIVTVITFIGCGLVIFYLHYVQE